MNKGRSVYTFQLNCEPKLVNDLICSYLQSNRYSLQTENGEKFYKTGDSMMGYKYFNYSISGQILTIYAWLKGAFGEVQVEQNSINMFAMDYRNSLNTLFQEIIKLNNNGGMNMNNYENQNQQNYTGNGYVQNNNQMNFDPRTGQPIQNMNQYNSNQFSQTFQDETLKKQEKLCEIGFWLSILGLLASFLGVAYGVFVYIMNFYFASQGLKTRKRGKAWATIILSIISILVIIFQVAMSA